MPQVGVEAFRKEMPLPEPADRYSAEAPQLPKALKEGIVEETQDGEYSVEAGPNNLLPAPQPSIPPALRHINLSKIETRTDFMRELNGAIPLNDFNLPKYFYRCDLITTQLLPTNNPSAEEAPDALQSMVEAATVFLDYHHGYPTLKTGMPFWSKLNHESTESFSAFCAYLELGGIRSFLSLQQYTPELLTEWFHLYSWAHRATSYDMFRAAHHERMRVERIMRTENTHYEESTKIYARIVQAFGQKTADELNGMEADKLIGMLEKVVKMQRVAAGLTANGGAEDKSSSKTGISVEVQMRQIAEKSGHQSSRNEDVDMQSLLGDLDALNAAQELIVRVNGGTK